MTIPPEILEQISEACISHPRQKDIADPEMKGLYRCGFIDGSKFGYSLCQKQTPPPTGKSIFILNMLHANNEGRVIGFECNQRAQKSVDKQPKVILGFNEYREVTDRDKKIAQAVEGLVESIQKSDLRTSTYLKAHQREAIIDALSKLEEAKNEKPLR